MANLYSIDSIKFTSGVTLDLKPDSIVVFVGANNAGKSKMLNEIGELTHGFPRDRHIIASLTIHTDGKFEDFLKKIAHRKELNHIHYPGDNHGGMDIRDLESNWELQKKASTIIAASIGVHLVKSLDTGKRLHLVTPPNNIDTFVEVKRHPIQNLKEDQTLEAEFSGYFKRAFGQNIIINHAAGQKILVHIGQEPTATKEHDRVSKTYQEELRKLPTLHTQGDGMKSFAGVALSLYIDDFTISLIDEPEAFLHPPQAFYLGQMVGQKLAADKQLFFASHSMDFLKGLLETAANRLIIVRLERDPAGTKTHLLSNTDVNAILGDTLLRHSNVLDSLFHKRVIVVESDSDVRFFSAMAGAIVDSKGLTSPDLLFVQTGGKERFPSVVTSIKKLGVPVTVIGDFDHYNDEYPIKDVFRLLGGDWSTVQKEFNNLKKEIDQKRPELETAKLKDAIKGILDTVTTPAVSGNTTKEIKEALKKSSPWSEAKQAGFAYIPAGNATQYFNHCQQQFSKFDLRILEIGELEAFDKTVGNHGPKWVNEVLKKDLIKDPALEAARKFVEEVILKLP